MRSNLRKYLIVISAVFTALSTITVDASLARSVSPIDIRAPFGLPSFKTLFTRVPRGGSQNDSLEQDSDDDIEEVLYLPGLLDTSIQKSTQPIISADVSITLSSAKAKELGVSSGDSIVLIGRRRKASYGLVTVKKTKKTICGISENMAKNLRLRHGDKLKVIPFGAEEDQPRSGDMVLMKYLSPPEVSSVTFSPIEDSLNVLEAREGGDKLSDDEIMERFVTPYLDLSDSDGFVKRDDVLTLKDENGKVLDFLVTHVELTGIDGEMEIGK